MSLFPLLTISKPTFLTRGKAPWIAAVLFVLAFGTSVASRADDSKVFRTARLSYFSGDVHVQQTGSSSASKAIVNLPLVEGAVLSTGDDGQAEIEFEDGSLLRLTPRSGAALVKLGANSNGDYNSRISLLGGLAYVELRGGTKYHYTVDAGGDQIVPIENAIVRVNFDQPPAIITILDGSAHLTAASGSDMAATAGQTVRAGDAADGGMYTVKEEVTPESWDQWNLDRDAAAANESSTETDVRSKYAGDQGYGWSDLDANGNWYNVPGQGEVWQPDAASQPTDDGSGDYAAQSSFDPYGYGSWAYTPAGYVWASGYGWGWLPYRCGTWNYWDGFGWGWSPAVNCGVFGFGGYYDGGVYIGRVPGNYKKPGRPLPKPGPIHPIVRGRGGPVPVVPVHPVDRVIWTGSSERVIAGNIVTPLPRAGRVIPAPGLSSNSRSAVSGAGLRRDYPIDRSTSTPITGLQSTGTSSVPASNARSAWHPVQSQDGSVRQPATVQRPGYALPQQPVGGISRPVPVARPTPISPPFQSRPSAPPPPTPRPAPAPAPASHPSAPSHGR